MQERKAVFLFDTTGNMAIPWAADGYSCHCYDLQNFDRKPQKIGKGIIHFHHWDAESTIDGKPSPTDIDPDNVDLVACFPPCTHLAVSGARWFVGKGLRALQQSVGFFATCAEICEDHFQAPYMIENPISTISTYWRTPDYTFHPCHYSGYCPSDNYTKQTCLWTGKGFNMPARYMDPNLEIDFDYIHSMPPSEDRAYRRSITPEGFARAVWLANRHNEDK